MSLLYFQAADHYDTSQIDDVWDTTAGFSVDGSNGRESLAAIQCDTSDPDLMKVVTNTSPWYLVGCAINPAAGGNTAHIWIGDASSQLLVFLQDRGDGGFDMWKGPNITLGTRLLRTRGGLVHAGQWAYIEIRGRIAESPDGEFHIYVNGRNEGSITGVDTMPEDNGAYMPALPWVEVNFSPQSTAHMTDLYIANGGGTIDASDEASVLGDVLVETIVASTGDGTHGDWTPSSGTDNGAMVDDNPHDDGTSYNESSTATDIDTYNFAALSRLATGTIFGVQPVMTSETTTSNDIRLVSLVNSSQYFSAVENLLGSDYWGFFHCQELSPDSGVAWTVAEIDASEFGVELNA